MWKPVVYVPKEAGIFHVIFAEDFDFTRTIIMNSPKQTNKYLSQ